MSERETPGRALHAAVRAWPARLRGMSVEWDAIIDERDRAAWDGVARGHLSAYATALEALADAALDAAVRPAEGLPPAHHVAVAWAYREAARLLRTDPAEPGPGEGDGRG